MASTIQIKRGTGSAVPSGLADGELAINLDSGKLYFGSGSTSVDNFTFGELTAEKYIVSSSVLYVTTSFSSGSTEFGDTADDTHTFTGNITASGNISASSNVYAADYFDNGANIDTIYSPIAGGSGIVTVGTIGTGEWNATVIPSAKLDADTAHLTTTQTFSGAKTFTLPITASGNISASGTITGNSLVGTLGTAAQANITSVGTLDSLIVDGDIDTSGNNITMGTGEIDGAGSVQSLVFKGIADQDLTIKSDGNITFVLDDDNDETGQSFSFKNDNTEIANLDESGNLQLDGHITASGNISASGTITAATLDAAAVSDALAAAIVAEIDNDEIPIAKLAEDSISGVALGSNLNNLTVDDATLQLNSGTTYNGSAARTISIKDGGVDSDALADDITVAGDLTVADNIIHSGDTDTKIAFGTDTVSIKAGNTTVFSSTVTGSKVENVHQNIYDTGSLALTANGAMGDIVKFGSLSGGGDTVPGGMYYLKQDGTWALTQANAVGTSTGSIAIAVGTTPSTDGMCLRGFINPFTDPGAGRGNPVYMSDTAAGRMLATPPSSGGDIVRIIGYQYGTDLIYFNPSNDYIIHA